MYPTCSTSGEIASEAASAQTAGKACQTMTTAPRVIWNCHATPRAWFAEAVAWIAASIRSIAPSIA